MGITNINWFQLGEIQPNDLYEMIVKRLRMAKLEKSALLHSGQEQNVGIINS